MHCGTASVRAMAGELSSAECERITIARLLLCMMPKAHSDALEYLMILFMSLVKPTPAELELRKALRRQQNHKSQSTSAKGKGKATDESGEVQDPFAMGAGGTITMSDISQAFGWDVCAPRDAVGYLASFGMLGSTSMESTTTKTTKAKEERSRSQPSSSSEVQDPMSISQTQVPLAIKERAEITVTRMATQVLWWLMCYWGQISGWREELVALEPKPASRTSALNIPKRTSPRKGVSNVSFPPHCSICPTT